MDPPRPSQRVTIDTLWAGSLNELIYKIYQLIPRHARVPSLQYAQPLLRIDGGGAIHSLSVNWHDVVLLGLPLRTSKPLYETGDHRQAPQFLGCA
jgi:hypothetical protein